MDLKQLDYFVHVAELGSFTKAASLLSIAQSALSHQVRQLEVEMKQTLLYRNGRGVTATEPGKRLLSHARGILAQVQRARDDVAEVAGARVGHVVIGVPASIAHSLAVPLVKRFRSRFPNATLGLVEGLSAYVTEWLVSGRVDIGLVFNPAPNPAVEIMPFLEQEMVLVARKSEGKLGAVQLKDLPRYPLILPSRPNANRMRIEMQLAYAGLKPTIALEIDGVSSVLDLVQYGYGYAVLPGSSLMAHPVPAELVTRPIRNPKLTIHMCLLTSSQRRSTPLARDALELVREVAGEVLVGYGSAAAPGTISAARQSSRSNDREPGPT